MTPTAAITLYELSVFVHVAAVVVGLGATFAESIMFPVAMRAGTRHLPYLHRLQLAISRWMAMPALAVVVATGVYQTVDGDWDFGSFWISATFAIAIVLGGLVGAYFVPSDRRLGALAERDLAGAGGGDGELSDEYLRGARAQGMLGALAGLLVIAAVFLMVTKPGA